jgi:hypothetical protein
MKVNRQEKPMHAEIGAHMDLKNRKKRKIEYPAMVNKKTSVLVLAINKQIPLAF